MTSNIYSAEALEPRFLFAFVVTNLVSNGSVAGTEDDFQMINPWGIASTPTGPWVIANNGTNTAKEYSYLAEAGKNVSVPYGGAGIGYVTGAVFNNTSGFEVSRGGNSGRAKFIFVTDDGTISGWNKRINTNDRAQILVDNSGGDTSYFGVAIGKTAGEGHIYAANFGEGTIDVFDADLDPANLAGSFTDPNLPAGYSPFNIQRIGKKMLVAYALKDDNSGEEVPGAGNGFVSVFQRNGTFVERLVSEGKLDAPWGFAQAPDNFGKFSGDLLVGNFGDGRINAFNINTGKFQGVLKDTSGAPIVLEGLWGIGFGNGAAGGATNALYFGAGINGEADGLFGRITRTTNSPNPNPNPNPNPYPYLIADKADDLDEILS